MKPAVQGIVVFLLTLGAHLEVTHGGLRAVIGDILDDGKSWTTIGAVSKGIAEAAVGEAENFALAILTGGDIRRD
ncbi:hypothetical protein ES707_14907 [subsurface metagenome]